jgi:hypothetical protein
VIRRLVTVDQISYLAPGNPLTLPDTSFSVEVASEEQPYQRLWKVGTKWTPLDCGWVEDAGTVILLNRTNARRQTIPTAEEVKKAAEFVVEVSFGGSRADLLIRPGEHLRLPLAHNDVQVRCQAGEAKVTIVAFPR